MVEFHRIVSSYETSLKSMYSKIFNEDIKIKINIGTGPLKDTNLFDCKYGCFGELYINGKKSIFIEIYDPEQKASELKFNVLQNLLSLLQLNGINSLK